MAPVLAACWLLGLFAAAPALRTSQRYGFTDRLRDALILGIAIPFALGFVQLLYPVACWIVLAGCIALAVARAIRSSFPRARELGATQFEIPYLLVAALAIVAWPQLMRPLLDGDSLSYHLPNAASWVQSHGLWTAVTHYWWYPPASELFATGAYAVAGPFAVQWSGFGALALLGFRIVAWARERFGAPPWLADALGAATMTSAPLTLQAGSLQNDVWLAAFFLEALWCIGSDDVAAMRTTAVTVLLKPYGWVLAAIAMLARRTALTVWMSAAAPIALWVVHDLVLQHHTDLPIASTWYPGTMQTSIAAHGPPAVALAVRTALGASPFAFAAMLAALGSLVYGRRDPPLALAALAALLLWIVMPFVYDNGTPQLATGASLRQVAPAIATGALLLLPPMLRASRIAYGLLVASSVFGAWTTLAVFWNDAPTRSAVGVAIVAVALVAVARRLRHSWPVAAGMTVAIVASAWLAGRNPVPYYADALRVDGSTTGVYAWIARTKPRAVGGWGLRLGVVDVLDEGARAIDLPDRGACAAARRQNVLLASVAESTLSPKANRARLTAARHCGGIRYSDGFAVVADGSPN